MKRIGRWRISGVAPSLLAGLALGLLPACNSTLPETNENAAGPPRLGVHPSLSPNRVEGRTIIIETPIRLDLAASIEISGIVRSRRDPQYFWTLNDSGDDPKVYAIDTRGELVRNGRDPEDKGTYIASAINGDWEDIALDASGNLIVCDVGNNSNSRKDLRLYILPEPEHSKGRTDVLRTVFFRYPEQTAFPAPRDDFNYDCEAVFTDGDEIFLFTKHRSDDTTRLYRLPSRAVGEIVDLELVGSFDIEGQPTAADVSPDGTTLAVLTYNRIWLFDRGGTNGSFLDAEAVWVNYRLPDGQCESLCWETDDALLIADEAEETSGRMFRVTMREIERALGNVAAPAR